MTELPDQCDFCDQELEEDEELEPIYIGSPPQPKPQRLKSFKDKSDRFEYQIQGRSISAHAALYEMLDSEDNIDLKLSDEVMECDPNEFVGKLDTPSNREAFDSNINRDKAAARLTIYPDFGDSRLPDMEVCPLCADNLKEEGKR